MYILEFHVIVAQVPVILPTPIASGLRVILGFTGHLISVEVSPFTYDILRFCCLFPSVLYLPETSSWSGLFVASLLASSIAVYFFLFLLPFLCSTSWQTFSFFSVITLITRNYMLMMFFSLRFHVISSEMSTFNMECCIFMDLLS